MACCIWAAQVSDWEVLENSDHQPIAEVLDLPATAALKRTAQQPKMLCS